MSYPPPATSRSLPTPPPSEQTHTFAQEETTMNPNTPQPPRYIWVVIGPAGCGKTSVAECLHTTFSLPYLEGDTFHTPENIAKMASGHPLADADRWDWLITLREAATSTLSTSPGVIVTCSALKRKYRDVLRIAAYHSPHIRVRFIYLHAAETVLMDRVRARTGHYMKDYMVASQLQSLEAPMSDEGDVLAVDAAGTDVEVQKLAVGVVREALAERGV